MKPFLAAITATLTLPLLVSAPARGETLSPADPDAQSVRREFQDPGKPYRPMVRWWWPGNDVAAEELRREIDELDAAGFGGAEIQPMFANFAQMPADREARIRSVGTPKFFENVRAAVDEAAARNMWIDLTFGSGWPTGGGDAVTPERAATGVSYKAFTVSGGQRFNRNLDLPSTSISSTGEFVHVALGDPVLPLPAGWDERLKARASTVSVLAFRGKQPEFGPPPYPGAQGGVANSGTIEAGTLIDLTGKLKPDGTLDWRAPAGDWQILAFRRTPLADRLVGNAIPGPALILDHLDRGAFDTYMTAFGEPLRKGLQGRMGKGLRALFVDSMELPTEINWSDDFLAQFARRRGYDLRTQMPYLIEFGYINGYTWGDSGPFYDGGASGAAVRRDYWRTVGELIAERYYEPLGQWASANGLLTRIQAHGAPADLLKVYGEASIPETEQMIASGSFDVMKVASSAADITGKRIVSSESFAAMGDPYWTDPRALLDKTDQMVVAGVNQIVYHGYPYRYDDRSYPGWSPFNTGVSSGSFASFMNSRNTFWPYIRQVNNYIARLQFISQSGTSVAPIAVLETRIGYDLKLPDDRPVAKALIGAGYAFNYINHDALIEGRAENGEFVTPGGARFKAVLINSDWLRPEVAEALAKVSAAGVGVVFVGQAPRYGEGLANFDTNARLVQDRVAQIIAAPSGRSVPSFQQVAGAIASFARPGVLFQQGGAVPFMEKRVGRLDTFFFRNPSSQKVELEIEVAASGVPQVWDAWTGKTLAIEARQGSDGRTALHLSLPGKGSALVVFDPDLAPGRSAAPAPLAQSGALRTVSVSGAWDIEAEGRNGKEEAVAFKDRLGELTDWQNIPRLADFSGAVRYSSHLDLTHKQLTGADTVLLDLGAVHDVAEVRINGESVVPMLRPPFSAEISKLLRVGRNLIEIRVVNSLSNSSSRRLPIYPIDKTLQLAPDFKPRDGGLLGPVQLRMIQK